MATQPTPEEAARKILEKFEWHGTPPGGILSYSSINGIVDADARWRMQDIENGLEYGQEQGWFRREEYWVRLTQAGYDEI